jgi:hypothetical protein
MNGRMPIVIGAGAVFVVAAAGAWFAFFNDRSAVGSNEIRTFLESASYLPLPLPDAAVGPGAIVETKDLGNGDARIILLGSIDDCGAPVSDLLIEVPGGGLSLSSEAKQDYSGAAALSVPGVAAGSNFDSAMKARFTVVGAKPERLNVIALGAWFGNAENATVLSAECRKWLGRENVFVVRDAYAVESGLIEVLDNSGTKADIGANVFKLSGSARFQGATQIVFESKIYVGIQNMVLLDGEFRTLSGDEPDARESDWIKAIAEVQRP